MSALCTQASDVECKACRRPLVTAWDEGLLVKADAAPLDVAVADALYAAGGRLYVQTRARWLIHVTPDRVGGPPYGSLHAEHRCPRGRRPP